MSVGLGFNLTQLFYPRFVWYLLPAIDNFAKQQSSLSAKGSKTPPIFAEAEFFAGGS